jgi:hypothetical protein
MESVAEERSQIAISTKTRSFTTEIQKDFHLENAASKYELKGETDQQCAVNETVERTRI